ncbi:hypothetical protein GCM10011351_09130 [Paraliobacillus quinghaiensis]|uniref:Uncharacterized protein n=1 Tax=Paraliobacillus quinghaiensis TaxID=470815 RepID=A0A917TLT0_9BACI|nr:hypothetical protein [Paraliobacillus quinghaiensis]GGM25615.1 hypothetical protein GCM10011351_09130 [Paraliobacillus quinghaiensis]
MYICPVCNGLENTTKMCANCQVNMEEQGRLIEQLGDYAPYLDDEGMKLFDGDTQSKTNHTCVHVYQCQICGQTDHVSIQEIFYH